MTTIVPSENVLSFWSRKDGEFNMGSPIDVARNILVLEERNALSNGVEINLILSKLESAEQFPAWLYKKVSRLSYKSVHFGEYQQDFLVNTNNIEEKFGVLFQILENLEINVLIIHAQHFKKDRPSIRKLFSECLPNTTILVENDGLGEDWASSKEGLAEIFADCPEFGCCLDICHLKDVDKCSLEDFVAFGEIRNRVQQIHYSYSSNHLAYDPYSKCGYPGYNPNHSLFSIVNRAVSQKTRNFILQYPTILEGVVPIEDSDLNFLREEISFLSDEPC